MINSGINYTIDTLPTNIGDNQFLCYETKKGKIKIGEIIGDSASSDRKLVSIDGHEMLCNIYKSGPFYVDLSRYDRLKCFKSQQEFYADYYSFLDSKKASKVSRKLRYIVNRNTFFCKTTTVSPIPYGYKEFSTKKEAIEYSAENLIKLHSFAEKIKEKINILKLILEKKKKEIRAETYEMREAHLFDIQAKPSTIKENDLLFKVIRTKEDHLYLFEIEENYDVSVKGFIKPDIAKLSDGTLLIERECSYSTPYFFKHESLDDVKDLIKRLTIKELNIYINDIERTINKLLSYCEKYKPFDKSISNVYFNKKEAADEIKSIENFLNNNSI